MADKKQSKVIKNPPTGSAKMYQAETAASKGRGRGDIPNPFSPLPPESIQYIQQLASSNQPTPPAKQVASAKKPIGRRPLRRPWNGG